jgi:membrane-bound ClpP family serine protease
MTSLLAQESSDFYLILGFVMFAVAAVLLAAELFVPSGGLIGLLCGIAVVGSVISFFKFDSSWGWGSVLAYSILGPITLVFGFKLWLGSPLAKRMILGSEVEAPEDPEAVLAKADQSRRERLAQLQELIGVEGVTETALRPVGVVRINNQRIDALAESGVIEADQRVVVVDVYDNQIKVKELTGS